MDTDSLEFRHSSIATDSDISSCLQGQDRGPVRCRAYETIPPEQRTWAVIASAGCL